MLIIGPDPFISQSSPDHSPQTRIDFSYYEISGPDICSLIHAFTKPSAPFQCERCNKIFTLKGSLNRHIRNVHEEHRPFKCTVCEKNFCQKYDLKVHFSSVHEKKKPCKCEIRCEICTVEFAHVTQVNERLKPYQCNWVLENGLLCGKKLYKAHNLKVHMQMHRGIKSFSCYICGKSFRQNAHLKKHKKIHFRNDHTQSVHEGKKAHTCAICQKSFAQKNNLYRHIKEHEGKQSHSCDICQKSFSQKGNLNRHVKNKHEKSGKAFSYPVITDHNGKRRFKCFLCDKLFILRKSLNSHARSVHEGKQPNIPSKGNHEDTKNVDLCVSSVSNISSTDWIYGNGYSGTTKSQ